MKIAITGVTGFVGRHIAMHLAERGHEVIGIGRRELARSQTTPLREAQDSLEKCGLGPQGDKLLFPNCLSDYWRAPLEDEDCELDWSGVDFLIHGAYDPSPAMRDSNIQGTIRLSNKARSGGVRGQMLISSYAALRRSSSDYANIKHSLESFFNEQDTAIVRPGLVTGNGGLYHSMSALVLRFPVIPLLNGGTNPVPLISIEDLAHIVSDLTENHITGSFNLFYDEQPSLKEVLQEIANKNDLKRWFIKLPLSLLSFPVSLAEKLRIRLPISTNNLKGLKHNVEVKAHSDMNRFPATASSWTQAIVRGR